MNPYTNLGIFNFILLPFLLALVYRFAYSYRNRHYGRTHPWRRYFLPALSVKLFGAIFIGLIYAYYYKGGDTFNYFYHSQVINSAMDESVGKWFNLLFRIPDPNNGEYYEYISKMEWYRDPSTYSVAALTAFLSVFTFNNYLLTAVLFAVISFTGIWALFRTFASLYPNLLNAIAISVLFIPSVFVWGSGIFKDSLCMFGLGWLTYSSFRIMLRGDFSGGTLGIAVFSFLIVATVKVYIIMAFAPALMLWILTNYTKKIKNPIAKFTVSLFFLVIVSGVTLTFLQSFSSSLGKYSIDKIASTAYTTRRWISYQSEVDGGSAYDLGAFSPTLGGMLSKFPQAVNVSLFRPYIWEARKPIVFISALEALIFLFLTIKLILTLGLKKILYTIRTEPTIQFCFIFALIFAFAVGITSYNFGALSRYKIPGLPFYAMGLIMTWYKHNPQKNKLFGLLKI
jgi:hypothetical protein